MNFRHKWTIAALLGLVLVPAKAEDLHHPESDASGRPPAAAQEQTSAPSMPMMNMMGQGGMPMMDMMGTGGVPRSNLDPAAMPMMDSDSHLEGRIAFLRTEMGITDAQATQWEDFARALRDSRSGIRRAASSSQPSVAMQVDFLKRVETEEQFLAARLNGLRSVKSTFAKLQAVLSEDQKRVAEVLLTQPVCFGPMGMM